VAGGDAHAGGDGRLGEVRVGVELAAEVAGLEEQPPDSRRTDGPATLGVEGIGVLLAQEGLLAVPGAAQAEGADIVERE